MLAVSLAVDEPVGERVPLDDAVAVPLAVTLADSEPDCDALAVSLAVDEPEGKGVPLDDSLKEKLTAIMTEERLKTPSNDIPDLGGGPGMQILMPDAEVKARQKQEEDYQQRVLARAGQAGLSPDQVNALQNSQKRQNEIRAFGNTMTRAFLFPAPTQK